MRILLVASLLGLCETTLGSPRQSLYDRLDEINKKCDKPFEKIEEKGLDRLTGANDEWFSNWVREPEDNEEASTTKANNLKVMFGHLKKYLDHGEYVQFLDAAKICVDNGKLSKIKHSEVITNPSQDQNPRNSRLNIQDKDYTVESFTSSNGLIKKISDLVEKNCNDIALAVLDAYIELHEVVHTDLSKLAKALMNAYAITDGNKLSNGDDVFPVVRAFIKHYHKSESKQQSKFSGIGDYYKKLGGDEKLMLLEQFRYRTVAFLRSTGSNIPELDTRLGDQFVFDDRKRFMEWLERMGYYRELAKYMGKRTKVKAVSTSSKPTLTAPKDPYLIEINDPNKVLLLRVEDEGNKEVFEGFLQTLGAQNVPMDMALFDKIMDKDEMDKGLCGFLRTDGYQKDSQIVSNGIVKFLLILTMHPNQEKSEKVFKRYLEHCKPYDQDEVLKDALAYPKPGDNKKSLVSFLAGRGYFDQRRYTDHKEKMQLCADLCYQSSTTNDSNPPQQFDVDTKIKELAVVKDSILNRPPSLALEEIFKNLMECYKPPKGTTDEIKATIKNMNEQFPRVIDGLFTHTDAFKKASELGIFTDLAIMALEEKNAVAFKAMCEKSRCKSLPLNILERFREEAFVKIDEKMNAKDEKSKEKVQADIIKLQNRFIQIFQTMNAQIKVIRNVIYDANSNSAGLIPGLNDRADITKDFNVDYSQALALTRFADLKPVRAGFSTWYDTNLIETSNDHELLGHVLMHAVSNHKLYLIRSILANPTTKKLIFRTTEGFRYLLLQLLYQTQIDKSMPDEPLELEHQKLKLDADKNLTTQSETFKSQLKKIEDAERLAEIQGPQPPPDDKLDAEGWRAMEAIDKSTLYEPKAPSNPVAPRLSPTESILFLLTTRALCPFEKIEGVESLDFDAFKKQHPKIDNVNVTGDQAERPRLAVPMDTYAHDFLLWFVDELENELKYLRIIEENKPVTETNALASNFARNLGGKNSAKDPTPSMKKVFFYIIKALREYMGFNFENSTKLINYGIHIIEQGGKA